MSTVGLQLARALRPCRGVALNERLADALRASGYGRVDFLCAAVSNEGDARVLAGDLFEGDPPETGGHKSKRKSRL